MTTEKPSWRAFASGFFKISSINILKLLVQLFTVPILARFLSPEEYGLAFMAMPFILFVMMLADSGIGNSLVRTNNINSSEWHSCFWVSCALGIILTAFIALAAPLTAYFLNEPRLTLIVLSLSLIVLGQTLTIVPGAALQKTGKFGTVAITEIVSLLVGIGVAVFSAVNGYGVWSLVMQQLSFYAVRMLLTLGFSPYRPRMIFSMPETKEHLLFGWNLLGSNLVGFISKSFENLIIGRFSGAAAVGIYSMAFQFARLPFMLVAGPLQYVIYPHVVKLREHPERMTALFMLLTRILAIVIFPSIGMVAIASKPIFHVLLSEKWSAASEIFLIVAPAVALQAVSAIMNTFLMAIGRTDIQVRLAIQSAIGWAIGLIISVWYGLEVIAHSYNLFFLVFSLWSLRISLPHLGCSIKKYVQVIFGPIIVTFIGMFLYWVISLYILNEISSLIVSAGICGAIILALLFAYRSNIKTAFHLL